MKSLLKIFPLVLAFIFISCDKSSDTNNDDESFDGFEGAHFVYRMSQGQKQTLVVYGTSVSSLEPNGPRWVNALGDELNRRYNGNLTLYNNGKSGQNSRWALDNLDDRVLPYSPDAVIVEFATNDAVQRFELSLDECRRNTDKLIDRIVGKYPKCEVILHTVCGYPLGANLESRPTMAEYNDVYRQIASERGLMYIDEAGIFRHIAETKGETVLKKFQGDGVHPTERGALEIIFPNVLKSLTADPTIIVNTEGN